MPKNLTPAQRSLRSRIGAYAQKVKHDPRDTTQAARSAGPASLDYWRTRVDPAGEFTAAERDRRANAARSEFYARLQLKSARARAAKKAS